ncbi:MAG: nicotinate-nucleotide adenylyltransferase [Sphingobacteriales bacterium]|nr:MAG: nicotinate-nucleotide adenylyltransferase [Sphingobacteriales bacterium]
MKTGLFFGSFNPVHIGHLIIGSHMVNFTDLKQVWFVVSPQNPLKNKADLLPDYQRLEMVQMAVEEDPQLSASNIEFELEKPSFTINTLLRLEEKYPDRKWVLIMGSDTLNTLPKWKNYEQLVANYEIYIYPRPDYPLDQSILTPKMKLVEDVPLMQISASFIRKSLREGRNVKYLLPTNVYAHISKWGYFLH